MPQGIHQLMFHGRSHRTKKWLFERMLQSSSFDKDCIGFSMEDLASLFQVVVDVAEVLFLHRDSSAVDPAQS